MKVPVYLTTRAGYYIGDVDIKKPEDFYDAADALWELQDYDYPTLCHHCADVDLNDWYIDDSNVDFYFR